MNFSEKDTSVRFKGTHLMRTDGFVRNLGLQEAPPTHTYLASASKPEAGPPTLSVPEDTLVLLLLQLQPIELIEQQAGRVALPWVTAGISFAGLSPGLVKRPHVVPGTWTAFGLSKSRF